MYLLLSLQRSPSTTKKRQKKPSPASRDSPAVNDSMSITADSLDGEMSLVIDDTASLGSTDAGMFNRFLYCVFL